MKRPFPGYNAGALAVVASTGLSVLAGFAALWCLNQILTKDMFGAYSVAVNAVFLSAIVATMGLDRAILLRIAGTGGSSGVLRGSGLFWRAAIAVGVASVLVALLLVVVAGPLVRAGALPDLAFWLPALALAVLPCALSLLVQGWLQANHQTAPAMILPGLSDIARAGCIGVAFLFATGAEGIAVSVMLGASLPLLVVAAWLCPRPQRRLPRRLTGSDFRNGALFAFQNLTIAGMRYLDVLLLGLLTTGAITADYTIAGRLAGAIDLGRMALKPTFTPRVRRHLRDRAEAALGEEYHALRLGGTVFALVGSGILSMLALPLLGLFGPYESACAPLLVLAAVHVMNAGTGMHSSVLSMSGEVAWSAAIRVLSLAALVLLILWLAPRYGALGAALAMLAVQAGVNLLSLLVLWHRRRFFGMTWWAASSMSMAVGALLAGAAGALSPQVVGGALLLLALAAWLAERPARRALLHLLYRSKEPAE